MLPTRRDVTDRLFGVIAWLAVTLIGVKAYYLGFWTGSPVGAWADVRALMAISYADLVFVAIIWTIGRATLAIVASRPLGSRLVLLALQVFCAGCCVYAVASVVTFWLFGGFPSYQLLTLVGDVRMVRSSVAAYLTPAVVATLVLVPVAYLGLARVVTPWFVSGRVRSWLGPAVAAVALAWIFGGHLAYEADWPTRSGRRVADNPHWVLVSSWWRAVVGDGTVRLPDRIVAGDVEEFLPPKMPAAARLAIARQMSMRSRNAALMARRRPPNVILVVLESVGARWTSLGRGLYQTTPNLAAESAHAVVFDNFYAHIGRSSNSLAAMLMSVYPKLDFRDLTAEYPRLPGTTLARLFRDHGYRTAFATASDLGWAGWDTFLEERGFDELADYHGSACPMVSSWGIEDRCLVDSVIGGIDRDPARPFFIMAWTTQSHHPYEPTPGVPLLNFQREPIVDDYDLERYLNVVHETDHQLGRLFEAIRRAGISGETIVAVTGDHGQSFGYPHPSYMQGRADIRGGRARSVHALVSADL